jgi:superfamily II DNA or RNA helicase
VPAGLLDPKRVREAKRSLTFKEISSDRVSHVLAKYAPEDNDEEFDYGQHQFKEVDGEVTVNEYREVRGGVSLPRAYAMKKFPHVVWRDNTKFPIHGIPFTGSIEARDEKQDAFFTALLQEADQRGPQNILANATTGAGKTVAGIWLGWQLSTPTLIVVDSNKIASGWLKNFRQFFGQGWTERYVGRAQQDECDYKGKAFVIAMAQSLASRKNRYPPAFYTHFGLQIIDEVQVFGGPHFSPILYMFPARVRLHLTAENRTGSFGRLIKAHAGNTRVVSKQAVMEPYAWVIKNKLSKPFRCFNDGELLTNLSRQQDRNEKLANLIYTRGTLRNRNVLILSNRTAQLLELRDRCVALGTPLEDTGIHCGQYLTNRYVVYYTLPNSTKRNRITVKENSNAAYRMIARLRRLDWDAITAEDPDFPVPTTVYNRLQAGEQLEFSTSRENFKPSTEQLDNITHSCSTIFATYEIFSKGVDVPKLDMGVEALPAGNVKQPLGRVLRLKDGKLTPEWYAIQDYLDVEELQGFEQADQRITILNSFFEGQTKTRFGALRGAGAKIRYQK